MNIIKKYKSSCKAIAEHFIDNLKDKDLNQNDLNYLSQKKNNLEEVEDKENITDKYLNSDLLTLVNKEGFIKRQDRINNIANNWDKIELEVTVKRKLRVFIKYAALFILFMAISSIIYFKINQPSAEISYAKILRGNEDIILIMKDSLCNEINQISLSKVKQKSRKETKSENLKTKFFRNDSKKNIVNRSKVKWHKIVVPLGGEYNFKLSDGTQVHLNSESELEYPIVFDGVRKVKLKGEAFFKVTASELNKFIVETPKMDISVMGTQFNVRAYQNDENVSTVLVKGVIEAQLVSGERILLHPNQKLIYNFKINKFKTERADKVKDLAWLDGLFVFKNDRLEDILKELKRWYDFNILYTDINLKDEVFGGRLERSGSIGPILDILNMTGKVQVTISGGTIIVKRK